MEDLDFAASDSDEDDDEGEFGESGSSMGMDEILADGETVWRIDHEEGLDSDELAELLDDAKDTVELPPRSSRNPPKKKRKTQSQEERKLGPKVVTPIFDLVEPEFVPSKASSHRHEVNDDLADAYGDAMSLHTVDAADKSARKKSLRFHTSKIDSASARRQGARNQAAGGDDDIPYRERKSAKDAKLVKEAAIHAQNQVGAPLDDEEPVVGQKRSRPDVDDDEGEEDPDEYYELVKKKAKESKVNKKEEYEAASGHGR